jgi:phosphoribosylanthranilate isomerase|tara:strand:- start:546 stop:1217 length:672 start_codon:yes stop_codon:yes gene_type:complete
MNPGPYVKVCCIASIEEAEIAVQLGASALGLVSAMPSGPGVIAEAEISAIARSVPPPIATFLLTARTTAEEIVAQHQRCGTSTLQLVDAVDPSELQKLRQALPGIKLVQVILVRGEDSLARALLVATFVDALLLDSGNQQLEVKELGGTGRVHDWTMSRRIRDESAVPLFLAGGLTAANVTKAIDVVKPHGVDLCSGVRTNGSLDPDKLHSFISAVRATGSPG